ncbi:DNA-independent NTPase [Cotia virus SPAn232]|uniref:DNA-independent NTPase n=2 Tax=Cotia virus TaxID=39444 RepID=H6TA73_9POXV|nr:DNA-independent NTPase [Cotia virus SPAn232]ADT91113.1 DNA-independent NTPase [Cotia virus SPAn232]AIT70714.1 DNA-independent NTPase [Cotia virus]
MDIRIENNLHIFVLKNIAVSSENRQKEDSRFVEIFTCDELEEYIKNNPTCTLFESIRDEENYSIVRVFFDVDLDVVLDEIDFNLALESFIIDVSTFVANFANKQCKTNKKSIIKSMRSNFSITKSTNTEHTSFHMIFINTYTTINTLIYMKKPLLEFIRLSDNPLIKAIDPAIYRRHTTLRIVGTRKTSNNNNIHIKQPPNTNISDYLFSYVDFNKNSTYFCLNNNESIYQSVWEPNYIQFSEAMKKVSKIFVNEIVNFKDFDINNFTILPIVVDYVTSCGLCKKKIHKHNHQLTINNGLLKIFKLGNPHSCKVKVISLEGNRLFTISQLILDLNVIHLTERGDHIVWIKNSWKFNNEDPAITKLILSIKDSIPIEYSTDILCPRKRKVIENNLKDMLIDTVETDNFPHILPFNNGVLDLTSNIFYYGKEAKDYICTISTGYNFDAKIFYDDLTNEINELEKIINDIQPQTEENKINRELYERTLSSCLHGSTKQCLTFFYGETSTGKSTTKRLLQSAINGLYIETGQTILTDILDKGPNPFISSIHLKRSVFCSELPDFACSSSKKIRSDNIKKLTEPCIIGRSCYSNKIHNRNHASIIIDTNYRPVFDRVDNALMRRIALVKFRTHFTHSSENVRDRSAYDEIKPLDENLDIKIQRKHFRYAFLKMLVKWYQKYHIPIMRLIPTPENVPDFVFHIKINSIIVPSSSTHRKMSSKLLKIGYVIENDIVVLPSQVFQQKIIKHFNIRIHGTDIESFISKHKKFASVNFDYLEYVFLEDINTNEENAN